MSLLLKAVRKMTMYANIHHLKYNKRTVSTLCLAKHLGIDKNTITIKQQMEQTRVRSY